MVGMGRCRTAYRRGMDVACLIITNNTFIPCRRSHIISDDTPFLNTLNLHSSLLVLIPVLPCPRFLVGMNTLPRWEKMDLLSPQREKAVQVSLHTHVESRLHTLNLVYTTIKHYNHRK